MADDPVHVARAPLGHGHLTYCGLISLRVAAVNASQLWQVRDRHAVCGTCRLHAEQWILDGEADELDGDGADWQPSFLVGA